MGVVSVNKERMRYACLLEILSILGTIAIVVQAFYMGKIVDNTNASVIVVLAMVLIIFFTMVVEIISKILIKYLLNKYINKRRFDLYKKLTDKLLCAEYQMLETVKAGNVLNVYTSDIEKILQYECIVFTVASTFIKVIVSFCVLLSLNIIVSLCIICASIIALIPGVLIGNLLYEKNKQLNRKEDELNEYFIKNISLIKLIKSYNAEKYYADRNDSYINQYKIRKNALNNNVVIYSVINGVFGFLPFIALFMVGAVFTIMGMFTIGGIISASFYIGILSEGIGEIQKNFSAKQSYKASIERVQIIESLEEKSQNRKKEFSDHSALVFQNVSFGYGDGTLVLKDFNLQIEEGSKVLVRGKSGTGKTTFLRLVEGLYEPIAGSINIGTTNYNQDGMMYIISAANQESILFPRTVRENIYLVNESLTKEKFEEICKTVCIDDSLLYMKNNERVVSNLGTNLSKGQLQRINLARALAKEADIYLFDEPTSGLSADMEERVVKNIIRYLQDKTVIMIMHETKQEELFNHIIDMDAVSSLQR